MKIYKSNYRDHWVSPYTILETVCFWEKDRDRIYNLDNDAKNPYQRWVDWLTPICTAWSKFFDFELSEHGQHNVCQGRIQIPGIVVVNFYIVDFWMHKVQEP